MIKFDNYFSALSAPLSAYGCGGFQINKCLFIFNIQLVYLCTGKK